MSKRRAAVAFAIGLFIAGNVSGQDLVPSSPAPEPAGATAEVERVIVTGSNIQVAAFQQQREDALGKVFCFFDSDTLSPDDAVHRSPIGAAKFF